LIINIRISGFFVCSGGKISKIDNQTFLIYQIVCGQVKFRF